MTAQREKQGLGLSADIFPRCVPLLTSIFFLVKNNYSACWEKVVPPHHNSKQLISDRVDMGQQEKNIQILLGQWATNVHACVAAGMEESGVISHHFKSVKDLLSGRKIVG